MFLSRELRQPEHEGEPRNLADSCCLQGMPNRDFSLPSYGQIPGCSSGSWETFFFPKALNIVSWDLTEVAGSKFSFFGVLESRSSGHLAIRLALANKEL